MVFKSLSNLFSKRDKTPVDFSSVITDMHSHLIPGIDDGAKTIEDSINLIKRLHAFGYRKLVTTPHIMSDYYQNTPEIILNGLNAVREAVKKENIDIEISAAAEYYIDDGFIKKMDEGNLLTFGSKHLLVEVSFINPPENLKQIIFDLQVKGYRPILAHPERYPFWAARFNEYENFKDAGVLLQINCNSLSGYYGPQVKKTAEKLIDANMVDLIGTDMHRMEHADAMAKVMREKYFKKVIEFDLLNKHL